MNGRLKFLVGLVLACLIYGAQAAVAIGICTAGFTVRHADPLIQRAFLAIGGMGWWFLLDQYSRKLIDRIGNWYSK